MFVVCRSDSLIRTGLKVQTQPKYFEIYLISRHKIQTNGSKLVHWLSWKRPRLSHKCKCDHFCYLGRVPYGIHRGTVRCTYGMVQLLTSGRYNIRRNVTKSERYKNGSVHDFSLWRNAKCSVQWCVRRELPYKNPILSRSTNRLGAAVQTGFIYHILKFVIFLLLDKTSFHFNFEHSNSVYKIRQFMI